MLGVFAEFETNLRKERQLAGIAGEDAYPPHIFLEALGCHIEDGGVIYTRLRDQDLDVFKEIIQRYDISEWT